MLFSPLLAVMFRISYTWLSLYYFLYYFILFVHIFSSTFIRILFLIGVVYFKTFLSHFDSGDQTNFIYRYDLFVII